MMENFHQMMQDQEESNSFISSHTYPKLDLFYLDVVQFKMQCTLRNRVREREKAKLAQTNTQIA